MKTNELNEYIKHYLERDKTNSAIMLTSEWGTGKSYYIRKELVPYLAKKENGSHKCLLVSLYGLTGIPDISKCLYLESKAPVFTKQSEGLAAGTLVAKTVAKGVASFFNIDLSVSDTSLQELYQSVDLSGKLIIFEDVERARFSVLDFLGYVNSLVEQDEVKVLIVANEKELIKYNTSDRNNTEQSIEDDLEEESQSEVKSPYTEETIEYLLTKEKTISDTILFEGDRMSALKNIIGGYELLKASFLNEVSVEEINNTINNCGNYNLRSFVFACQKTEDILEKLPDTAKNDQDFVKTIFFSITIFSLHLKSGIQPEWKDSRSVSYEHGSEKYPLFRFCYDYNVYHRFSEGEISSSQELLRKIRLYDSRKSVGDPDLQQLYAWYVLPEKEVIAVVKRITERLKEPSSFAFQEYGKIAAYLISLHYLLDCDISEAENLLVSNLEGRGSELQDSYLFPMSNRIDEDEEANKRFCQLKERMELSLNKNVPSLFDFSYKAQDIKTYYRKIIQETGAICDSGIFASGFDNIRVAEMLKTCSAEQLHDFRAIYLAVYRPINIREFLHGDYMAISDLLSRVKNLQEYEGYDRIQKKQIMWFVMNLEEILEKL